jgi:hypothetical protein
MTHRFLRVALVTPTRATATTTRVTLVGNDPNASGRASTMKTIIIPLRMTFVAGGQNTSDLNDLVTSATRHRR